VTLLSISSLQVFEEEWWLGPEWRRDTHVGEGWVRKTWRQYFIINISIFVVSVAAELFGSHASAFES